MPRIAELIAYHARIPLKGRVRHASHTRHENDTLLVCCRLDDGTLGWGEGLPRPYVTGETIDTAWEQFGASDLLRQLGGELADLAAAMRACDRLKLAGTGHGGRDCFGNSVRCAVELSVLDALGRVTGQPLSTVTQLFPEAFAIRESRERARYSGVLTPSHPWREYLRAGQMRYYKFQQAKVKVGVAGIDDAACLARLRRVLPRDFDLRLDANESWSCATLESRLAPLLKHRVSSLEQPVPHGEVDGLASLRGRVPVPIMLDESLCDVDDARRAIERGTCDLFNIRLSKCGGFQNSLRLAALAHQAGLGCQLGCQVGETGILSAAGRQFACSVAGLRYVEGSFDRLLVKEPLTLQDITFGRGGWGRALTGPGLGVDIDPTAVKRVTVREVRLTFSPV